MEDQNKKPTEAEVLHSPFDGPGAGDHNEEYKFGRRPNTRAPFPFTERQLARLLVVRGRVQEVRDAGIDRIKPTTPNKQRRNGK